MARQFKPGQLQTGSLYNISASYAVTASYSLNGGGTTINTGSFVTTSSFNAFTASYATGSFTGSFIGDGSQLTGIVSSKWTGSNPISRQSDVEITGSLRVQGSITGSLFGTASWATNAVTASYAQTAQTASYVLNAVSASYVNSLNQQIILSGSLKLDPTQDPDPSGSDLDSTVLFQSSSNTALGYDLYVRQNGNLVKWKWIEGSLETGLLYGGAVTYSGSNVFVSPGSGIIAEHNATTGSEASPMIEYVTWNSITQSITNIATQQVTYLYIDNTGALQQQSTRFTSQQYHDYIPLGAVGHFDYTQVSAFGGGVQTAYDQISQISNFVDAFGPLKMSGYGLTGQAGSLRLSVGAGTSFIHGGFYQNNPEFPSQITTPSQATASLARVQRSGSAIEFDTNAGNFYTVVDPTQYDRDGDGVLHSVGSGNWSIQRVFADPKTGVLYVYYGQARYTSLLNALQYLPTDPFTEGDTFDFTTFVGFLVLKGNASNITDTATNSIINGGLFRGSGQGSGGGIALSNLDDLTDVTILSPTNGQALVYNAGIWQNGVPTSSSFATSASYATQALSASYAPDTTFPYTGSARITGSLAVTGSLSIVNSGVEILNTSTSLLKDITNESSLDWSNRIMYDAAGVIGINYRNRSLTDTAASQSISWGGRTLNDTNTSGSVDWNIRILNDTGSKPSLRWQERLLQDAGGKTSIDWTNRIAYDSATSQSINWGSRTLLDTAASQSIDWNNRQLKNVTGTVILDWRTAQFTGTASFATQALSASFATQALSASFATQALSASWAPGGAAGAQGNIQFNDGGTFGYAASTELLYNTASRSLHNGDGVVASGLYSHAEGINTLAQGQYSHAEGESTTTGNASGYYAEMLTPGVFTISSSYGDLSSAGLFDTGYIIGVDDSQYDTNYIYANLTVASCSFDGTNTIVHVTDTSFLTSTAIIGSITNFSNSGDRVWGGYGAHAEGYTTTALGTYSHGEGTGGQAYGAYSHAEGDGGQAYGAYSHAEGNGYAYGYASHAEGQGTTYGDHSHAEGESTTAGYTAYRMNAHITAGVIDLEPIYGDQTGQFGVGGFAVVSDKSGDLDPINNTQNTYLFEVSSSAFTSSLTQITLVDTTVTTSTNFGRVRIGVYGNANPTAADVSLGTYSHTEGVDTKTMGEYSHAAGNTTEALGWYQSVVGMGNKPISDRGAFIVGDGDPDNSIQHNLLVAAAGSVTISGSLLMSGSLIVSPTSSGTPAYTGKDGEVVFGQTGADYKIYVWLGGAWRSGSLS
jgi:hypothetical protein